MSILYKKDLVKLDGSDPMLLYGYGSYEVCFVFSYWKQIHICHYERLEELCRLACYVHCQMSMFLRMLMIHFTLFKNLVPWHYSYHLFLSKVPWHSVILLFAA
jgi:hypothetical protein